PACSGHSQRKTTQGITPALRLVLFDCSYVDVTRATPVVASNNSCVKEVNQGHRSCCAADLSHAPCASCIKAGTDDRRPGPEPAGSYRGNCGIVAAGTPAPESFRSSVM